MANTPPWMLPVYSRSAVDRASKISTLSTKKNKQSLALRIIQDEDKSRRKEEKRKEEICTYQILPKQGALPGRHQARDTSIEGYIYTYRGQSVIQFHGSRTIISLEMTGVLPPEGRLTCRPNTYPVTPTTRVRLPGRSTQACSQSQIPIIVIKGTSAIVGNIKDTAKPRIGGVVARISVVGDTYPIAAI